MIHRLILPVLLALGSILQGANTKPDALATNGRYKWWAEEKGAFLFDLQTDPYEVINLAADPAEAETLQEMRMHMLDHLHSSQNSRSKRLRHSTTREGIPSRRLLQPSGTARRHPSLCHTSQNSHWSFRVTR